MNNGDKMRIVFFVIISAIAFGGLGFYAGNKFSFNPVTTALSTLGDIVYDEQAEAEFNTKVGILDAQIEEKEVALAELEQKNRGLENRVANNQEVFEATQIEFEVDLQKNNDEFADIKNELIDSLEGNRQAQNKIDELNQVYISNLDLFKGRLKQANYYITVLEDANRGLKAESALMRSINKALSEEVLVMHERIEDISGSRARHGPGIAVGVNPMQNYGFTTLVGWTISWS